MSRSDYIMDFAVCIALGGDDQTKPNAEYFEARNLLDRAEIMVPCADAPLVAVATA